MTRASKYWPLCRFALQQLNAGIEHGTRSCDRYFQCSLPDRTQVTDAGDPITFCAPTYINGRRSVDSFISVRPQLRLAYRGKDVPDSLPDPFGFYHIILEPFLHDPCPVLRYSVYLSASACFQELLSALAGLSFPSPMRNYFGP